MNLLLVVASLSGGGAERVAVSWANALSAMGHRVTLLTDTSLPATYRLSRAVAIERMDTSRQASFILRVIGVRMRLLVRLPRLMRSLRPDVVIDVGHLYATEVLLAARLMGVKALQTDHNPCTDPLTLHQRYHKFLLSRFYDRVTVLSSVDFRAMMRRGVRNAVLLHNPLPLEPCHMPLTQREKTVLAVGRLDAWHCKGFDLLLDVWSRLSPRHPGWRLRLVGSGSEAAAAFLRRRAIDTVDFKPYMADIASEYRQAGIFVLSSRREGWGLVAVEAMSQGCAAVVCDFGGRQSEYITDGENGLLCPAGDPDALERCLERLIVDGNLRRHLQLHAPASLTRYAPSAIALSLHSLLTHL